jgi:hypothetical protein
MDKRYNPWVTLTIIVGMLAFASLVGYKAESFAQMVSTVLGSSAALGPGMSGKTTLAYGTVTNPNTSKLTVTYTNVGDVTLYPAAPTIDGTNSAEFAILTTYTYPASVAVAATYSLEIKFTPNTTAGAKAAALHQNYTW